jgi:anti-sigma factor RsiW
VKHSRHTTALSRLLGPGEPGISCAVCSEELDFYVDLQLAGADADGSVPGVAVHLRGCPACSEEHAELTALVRDLTRSYLPE